MSCGFLHTLAVAEEGHVLVSGCGARGQLGLGDTQERLRMTRLAGDFAVRVVMVSAGFGHSALQDSDGELWMSGRGDDGQLGTAEREDMLTPTWVPFFARVKMAACGREGQDGGLRGVPHAGADRGRTFVAAGSWHSVAVSAGGGTFT